MKNVLISNPSMNTFVPYLPYVWGLLRTYAEVDYEQSDIIKENYRWCEPIWQCGHPDELLKPYRNTKIDILGISCYMWNIEINLDIARKLKEANPDLLVVAGGPHPSWSKPGFIDSLGIVDVIITKEGEIPFAKILHQHAAGGSLEEVPNLILRGNIRTEQVDDVIDMETQTSPWLYLSSEYARHADTMKRKWGFFNTAWETSRGCPFSCSYCSWMSAKKAKVRKAPKERVFAEAGLFSRWQTGFIFISDSNFGTFPRDVEIAAELARLKKNTGFPMIMNISPAKNSKKYVSEIYKHFYDAKMIRTALLGFQHTRKEVLDAIGRKNIPLDNIVSQLKDCWEKNVPIVPNLIQGLPGDTPELWKGVFDDLLNWGFHEDIWVHDFILLPNCPAAQPEYREKWEIETVRRRFTGTLADKDNYGRERHYSDFVVATSTFSKNDWKDMKIWSACVQGLHNYALTMFIARYLKSYHNVSYMDFYSSVIDGSSGLIKEIKEHLHSALDDYLENPDSDLFIDVDTAFSRFIPLDQYVFMKILMNMERFYTELRELMRSFDLDADVFEDIINFQRDIIISTDYDPYKGRTVTVRYNWFDIFKDLLEKGPFVSNGLVELEEKKTEIIIRDDKSGLYNGTDLRFTNLDEYYGRVVGKANDRHFTTYFRNTIMRTGTA